MPDSTAPIAWIDVETTGVNARTCDLLEIAAVVTTGPDFTPVDEGISVAIHPNRYSDLSPAEAVARVQGDLERRAAEGDEGGKFVQAMHTASGLFADIAAGDCVGLARADEIVHGYLKQHFVRQGAILGGNSITLDRNFMEAYAPRTFDYIHYRSLDCTSVFELMQRVPHIKEQHSLKVEVDGTAHRAMADILTSIKQARMFSKLLKDAVPAKV